MLIYLTFRQPPVLKDVGHLHGRKKSYHYKKTFFIDNSPTRYHLLDSAHDVFRNLAQEYERILNVLSAHKTLLVSRLL